MEARERVFRNICAVPLTCVPGARAWARGWDGWAGVCVRGADVALGISGWEGCLGGISGCDGDAGAL